MTDIDLVDIARALALLVAANATPIVTAKLAGGVANWPLDGGCRLPDGRRLFGDHKTWRGLVLGTGAGTLTGALLGVGWWLGAVFALTSLLGDALSSAIKRRLNLEPGREIFGLDQLGEAVLPLWLFAERLHLTGSEIFLVVTAFVVADLATAGVRRWAAR